MINHGQMLEIHVKKKKKALKVEPFQPFLKTIFPL